MSITQKVGIRNYVFRDLASLLKAKAIFNNMSDQEEFETKLEENYIDFDYDETDLFNDQ